MAYVTVDELSPWIGQTTTRNAALVDQVIDAASEAVDLACGRRFDNDTTTSTREFYVSSAIATIYIDDAMSIGEVAVDTAGEGTFTAVASSDYDLLPLNGVGPDQRTGWPTTAVHYRNGYLWPSASWPTVRVSARWGWVAVPSVVKQATIRLASTLFHHKDTKLGVLNFGEVAAQIIDSDPTYRRMLERHLRPVDGFGA